MSIIRKFEVSTVVEVVDPATDEERAFDEDIDPITRGAAVREAKRVFEMWLNLEREYISVHIAEVP